MCAKIKKKNSDAIRLTPNNKPVPDLKIQLVPRSKHSALVINKKIN